MTELTLNDAINTALVLLKSGWTDVEPAVDADGVKTACWGKKAVQWTLLGAIFGCDIPDKMRLRIMSRLSLFYGKDNIGTLNASRDAAIAALERCMEAPGRVLGAG